MMVYSRAIREDDSEDSLFPLPAHDELGVLTSTRSVIALGEHVWINRDQVATLGAQWAAELHTQHANVSSPTASAWDTRYHFHDGTERTVNWLLVLDALNFCFWAEKEQSRWTISYQDAQLSGYWAEAASLKRAVEEDIPIWDAQFLHTISEETVIQIFRPAPGFPPIPLLEQRIHNMREVGQVLLERFDGQFSHAIEQAAGSAIQLALLLADAFPSFCDVTSYRGHSVYFLKRAQICAADLYSAFGGNTWGTFHDLDHLTIFADYKLPQVLRHYQVIAYDPALAGRVDTQGLIPAGSEEEVEIRAATVWACELLRQVLLDHDIIMSAAAIDQRLWLLGQELTGMKPYHRTRTMFY